MHQAMLLPGGVLPKDLAYEALVEALGPDTHTVTKDLELYATNAAPHDYTLELEITGVSTAADAASFARFHLVGYSAGGAVAIAFAAAHPQRVLSLALLEPAAPPGQARRASSRCVASRFRGASIHRRRDNPVDGPYVDTYAE